MTDHIARLKAWASSRGLEVSVSDGRNNQREPDSVVALRRLGDPSYTPGEKALKTVILLSRTSMDCPDTAAMYLINTLEQLGIEIDNDS